MVVTGCKRAGMGWNGASGYHPILHSLLSFISKHGAARTCVSDLAGVGPSSLIGVAGAYPGTKILPLQRPPASMLLLLQHHCITAQD